MDVFTQFIAFPHVFPVEYYLLDKVTGKLFTLIFTLVFTLVPIVMLVLIFIGSVLYSVKRSSSVEHVQRIGGIFENEKPKGKGRKQCIIEYGTSKNWLERLLIGSSIKCT